MIGFELPAALLGLLCIGLPVLIHALARRAPRELVLPTVRFLDAEPRSRRRLERPQDVLVLVLRALAIAAFALVAARPFVSGAAPASRELVLVLDDTLSMAHGEPFSRLDRAKVELERALEAAPADARV